MTSEPVDPNEQDAPPVITDKRRFNADGTPRDFPAAVPAGGAPAQEQPLVSDRESALVADLEERTDDLLRLKAEYDNYRRRVERERVVITEQAVGAAAAVLLPVLDDVDRAKMHEELTGGFKAVAEGLDRAVASMGLTRIGEVGEAVDWSRHEAVLTVEAGEHPEGTVVQVLRTGWTVGDRVLRPAQVSVTG